MLHVKHSQEPALKMCTRCGDNPRRAHHQRLCSDCHAAAQREYRDRRKQELQRLRAIVAGNVIQAVAAAAKEAVA